MKTKTNSQHEGLFKPAYYSFAKFFFISLLFFLPFCKDTETPSSIVFKDANGNRILEDTINASFLTTEYLTIESLFKSGSPVYYTEVNDNEPVNITESPSIESISNGWSGQKEKYFENVRLRLNFDVEVYDQGDVLRIKVKVNSEHGDLTASKYYKIEYADD